jgi:hypothetical protein
MKSLLLNGGNSISRKRKCRMDTYFKGVWRMDWGMGNPNKTAVLVAMLMIGIWSIVYFRNDFFWAVLLLFAGLSICLVHTFSRGGILAACMGFVTVIAHAPRPWPQWRTLGVLVAIGIVVATFLDLNAEQRFTQGIVTEDRSISNRIELWKSAPRMIMDAPNGWGLGNAGQAYIEWYQPLGHRETYRTLVNSHLTWLVEFGWPLRILYLLGWTGIFAVCWPVADVRWTAVPFGIWVTFAIGAFFSSVAEAPCLWILPGISFLPVIFYRFKCGGASIYRCLAAPVATVVGIGVLSIIAENTGGLPLRCENGVVIVGHGVPMVRVVTSATVFGRYPGRRLREYWLALPPERRRTIAIGAALY